MNLGMRGHDLDCHDIVSLSQKCKEVGIKNLQLALLKSISDISLKPGTFSPGLAHYIKNELDKNDVHVAVLGCYINPIHPDEAVRQQQIELFCEHIKFGKYIGADMIGTETGSLNADFSFHPDNLTDKAYAVFMESMRQIVPFAEKLGVMVGIEAVHSLTIHSPKVMKRFLDDINSPNVSVIFDPVNYLSAQNYQNQRQIMNEAFELYGDRIAAVHLKDFTVQDGKFRFALPMEGQLEYAYLFGLLKEHKPQIVMLLEEVKEKDLARITEKLAELYYQ